MVGKRGITPIIAIILLLLMTVLAGAATMLWIQKLQGTLTSEAERGVTATVEKLNENYDIIDVTYDSGNNLANVTVLNTGTMSLNLTEFTIKVEKVNNDGSTVTQILCVPTDNANGAINYITTSTCSSSTLLSPGKTCLFEVNFSKCSVKTTLSAGNYYLVLISPNGKEITEPLTVT